MGRAVIRRAGWRGCTPVQRSCWSVLYSALVCHTFLLERFALVSRLSIRFYWNVLRSPYACQYVSIGAFCVCFTPVSFPLSGKERRLAGGCVSIPPWVVIAIRAFSNVRTIIRLCGFTSGLRVFWRRSRRGTESAARCRTLLRDHIGFAAFSAGSTLGEMWKPHCGRAPRPAPKSHWLSGLSSFDSRQSAF